MKNKELINKINEIINNIRIWIQNEGGDVNFVSFEKGILTLIVSGHCIGCTSFDTTYTYGLKQMLMQMFPQIKNVVFLTKKPK
jgi:Fe-S cluster biogenesis protein NfuA